MNIDKRNFIFASVGAVFGFVACAILVGLGALVYSLVKDDTPARTVAGTGDAFCQLAGMYSAAAGQQPDFEDPAAVQAYIERAVAAGQQMVAGAPEEIADDVALSVSWFTDVYAVNFAAAGYDSNQLTGDPQTDFPADPAVDAAADVVVQWLSANCPGFAEAQQQQQFDPAGGGAPEPGAPAPAAPVAPVAPPAPPAAPPAE